MGSFYPIMKHLITIILTIVAGMLTPHARAEDTVFKPLTEAPKSTEEEFFQVNDGECKIEGHVVKLFVVKPEYLTASYKNDSKKALFPKFTVRTYNHYGYLLGSDNVGASMLGGSPQLDTGDVGGEKIIMDLVDVAGVFKHALAKLPSDFFEVAWISLSDTNTRLSEKASSEQAASRPESKSESGDKPQPKAEGRAR